MNKNFTFVIKCITLIIIAIVLIATISYAQTSTDGGTGTYNTMYINWSITLKATALNNGTVNLLWTTNAEFKNDHFEVQRSFDQSNFSIVGIISDVQNVNGASGKYSFTDDSAQSENHKVVYYRLKQVDADGKFTYSAVKMVRISDVTKVSAQVLPNPYMDKLNINFVSIAGGNAEVKLISASGTLVKIANASITKGYNNIQLQNLNSQAAGLYIAIVVVNGQVIANLKVVKQ
jgi:hypothetical protein